jgi:2'-hydroxyisoflavone reductase
MKVLILGGTLFLGRHLVEAAQARGHEVTLFNRGKTNPDLFREIEKLRGDRDTGDLSALEGRSWDAVVDTSARIPRWVREFAEAVGDRVGHYTSVSSISVYADTSEPGTDETARVHVLADERVEEISNAETYGALKALCERTAEKLMPGRVLCVRPGLIIGPYDDSGRFAYWVHRIARGGNVVAPEPREQPVQLVDARDLAEWILGMAEKRECGVFNATGPERPLTMAEMLQEIVSETGGDAGLAWVDERSLVDAGVEAWSDLPLWLAPNVDPAHAGFLSIDTSKALVAGLVFRPLGDSIRDTLEHAETNPEAGLDPVREQELLPA